MIYKLKAFTFAEIRDFAVNNMKSGAVNVMVMSSARLSIACVVSKHMSKHMVAAISGVFIYKDFYP